MRVLAIEDNPEVSDLLRDFLTAHGFQVECMDRGTEAAQRVRQGFDAVILDVGLPDTDGFEVLKHLRRVSSVPVILLTNRGAEEDRIAGLELGADDYLPKPFNPRELLARLKAIVRRNHPTDSSPVADARVSVNGIVLDTRSREVTCEGLPVAITTVEFSVLEILIRAAGRPVSRDELMLSLYGRKATPYDRSLDMHVSHLRRKLKADREIIKTVRGAGYQFCVQL